MINSKSPQSRLVFMDLLRAYAVFMMVQGHTIEVFLKDQYRSLDNPFFNLWNFNRGLTAPLFLFSTGLVFNFLFSKYDLPLYKNPRLLKGIRRAVFLLIVSLAFRYPGLKFSKYAGMNFESWKNFLAVDVLQLIAVALLIVLLLDAVADLLNRRFPVVFISAALLVLGVSRFFFDVDWIGRFPLWIAAFLNHNTGSPFPIFPWLFYVLLGAAFGPILHSFRTPERLRLLIRYCLLTAAAIIGIGGLAEAILFYGFGVSFLWVTPALDIFRMGFVALIVAFWVYVAQHWQHIPDVLTWTGRNSLWVYLLHVIILYGSAYNDGFNLSYRGKFDPPAAILFALLMLLAMGIFVYGKETGTKLLKIAGTYAGEQIKQFRKAQ